MILMMRPGATEEQVAFVEEKIRAWGGAPARIGRDADRTILLAAGNEEVLRFRPLARLPGVETVLSAARPYRLAGAAGRTERTVLDIPPVHRGGAPVRIGGRDVVMIAGPCSIESREQLFEIAACVRAGGGSVLRAGAFKPRTSPYAFQGLGDAGLELLAEARERFGLPVITEVVEPADVDRVGAVADILQVGARNMQNFPLLKRLGQSPKAVMIKRGPSSRIEELLLSAEYVLNAGNPRVLLCERGIRTFEPLTRYTLDLSALPVLRRECHLPLAADPSHGTGHWDLVEPMALAAVAAGADALTVEVHPHPADALSDGAQALLPDGFGRLVARAAEVARAVGRKMAAPA